ncbi:MAG: saccharopine dehydrogenase NADP-binding domain-containing protein [Ardenticatenaceae bacterium]|nr:saccharopine dehydrogenase NADP-binding domain-containing protein [Ardenticatenaceae bacterium]
MKIVVLGGAGMMGCIAVQDLARSAPVDEVMIADLNVERAQEVAAYIDSPKVSIMPVDVRDHEALVGALRGAQTCLNATVYYTNLKVMGACLEAGVHYTDLGGLFHTTRKQLQLHEQFSSAGLSAILGMGSAPGIPNVQSRYAVDRLDSVESVRIYDGIKPPPPHVVAFSYAVPTILDELTMSPMVYQEGEYDAVKPLTGFEDFCFTPPLGFLPMHFSLHSEVATIPSSFRHKGLRECFFKINYWGMAPETVEKVKVLADFGFASREAVQVGSMEVAPRDLMVALLGQYVPPILSFLEPPQKEPPDWAKEIVTVIQGTRYGKPVTFRVGTLTVKGSLPTGVAPSIAAQWLAEGHIPPGVYPPEVALDPEPFFTQLNQRGIPTQVSVTEFVQDR